MSAPTADQFEAFYKAATLAIAELELAERRAREPAYEPEKPPKAKEPFPWQNLVAARVCGGDWPRAIALPTAAGKTACIDIAVFALACGARDAPRRIFFVVDRRIVVDQAFEHAKKLAKVLHAAEDGILKHVADALREIAEPGSREWDEEKRKKVRSLDVYALRGGMYRESAWARSPLQPTVIASTVDQVGSRLLFRGYGVSDAMKPIHAGLVGNDSLILLDEAHCAKPFDQTMQAIESYRTWGEKTDAPFRFVSMTATPTGNLSEAQIERDEEADRAHPELGKRIKASKPAALVVAEKAKGKTFKQWGKPLVDALAIEARKLVDQDLGQDEHGMPHAVRCVGIIVNRVATARGLAELLGADAVLLTGRMRPLDRDRVFTEKLQPLLSGASGTPPKFVVGTQCLECGADFDFHALVTECASLDALRQRFGRLNRVAARPGAKAVIVVRADQTEDTTDDPVYGESLAKTWQWLNANAKDGAFDFGVSAVRKATEGVDLVPLNAPSPDAPVLFPAHLDCWVQTHPIPDPDPDPALFLHGPKQPGQPDVQVVFRADLGDDWSRWAEIVGLCPPSSSEAVAVPIGVFKKWLAGARADDETADVESGAPEEADDVSEEPQPRHALRWRGPEEGDKKTKVVSVPKNVTPNDTYVIPCSAPGIGGLGDFPLGPVADDSGEAFQRSRDKAIIRFVPAAVDTWPVAFRTDGAMELAALKGDVEDRDECSVRLDEVLDELGALDVTTEELRPWKWLRDAALALARPEGERTRSKVTRREVDSHPLGGLIVTGTSRLHQFDPTYLDDSEPGESFMGKRATGKAVSLNEHSAGVAEYATRFATGCHLDDVLYAQAGLWHDLGKLDPRFQAMLRQSSPRTARAYGEPLAKSGKWSGTKKERDEAREVHKYPDGARHELLSAALVAALAKGQSGRDADDLLLHLIATHHGSARPFAAAVEDTDTESFAPELFGQAFPSGSYRQQIREWNAELPERFWRVVRKYGWWGAAYREAVFRLADHAQSAAEQDRDAAPAAVATGWVSLTATAVRAEPHALPLTGLDGANPLAFLAALGTLRLAGELFPGAALSWTRLSRWQPVLWLQTPLSREEFVTRLHTRVHCDVDSQAEARASARYKEYRDKKKRTEKARQSLKDRKLRGKDREAAVSEEVNPLEAEELAARQVWLQNLEAAVPAPFLSLGKSIAVTSEEFAAFSSRTAERLHRAGSRERADADFTPAFGCEVCLDRHGNVIPTEFQLVNGSGHQFFLVTFGSLMQSVTPDQLRRALFGPWSSADMRLSFRWDPIDDRRYAVSWEDPSSTEVRTEHGANLLAAFALPLLPTVPTARGARTTGFNSDGDETVFSWPVWENARGNDNVGSVLRLAQLHEHKTNPRELESHGIAIVYRVRKFEVGSPPLSKLNLCAAVPT